ncbi:MAG: TldD/PmbA family protein [Clostridia bacterium]|nr:TldD/PmbA family protein [Clostridia bacterium]
MNRYSSYLKKKKPLLKELIEDLSAKYDFASVFATDVKAALYMADSKMSVIKSSPLTECGFVVRILSKGSIFEYSFSDIDKKTVGKIISDIDDLASSPLFAKKVDIKLAEEEKLEKKFMRKQKGKVYSDEEILAILSENVKYGMSLGDDVINARCAVEFAEYNKMYLSKNRDLTQYYTWINPRVFVMVKNDKTMKYAYDGDGTNDSDKAFEIIREGMKKSYDLAHELLDAELPEPGVYTIITDPSITGLIAHEAFGHGVEMDQFVKDRAKGAEYIGEQVGSKILSMHDGADAAYSVASYFFDDEGVLASDTKIIEKGTLLGGICDSVSAAILGYHPTGNGRRESYKHKAYTRMTNTFFEKGKSTLDEMIESVDYGYYIGVTNNGMEDPKNWGIQCTALYGKEIKDGKFTGKIISPVVMSGYVIDLLKSISMISKDNFVVCGSGSCGKGYKEWVRVSDGGSCIKAEVKIG